jgi:poly(beta-D-mannuronate) lyase
MKKLLLYFLLSSSFVQFTIASVYRVNSEQQFKMIVPKLMPGDEVVIANGSYSNWVLDLPSNGLPNKVITIRAAQAGKVIFYGDVEQTLFKLTGSYLTLRDIVFNSCNLLKTDGKTGILIELKNTKNCSITNCTFTSNTAKAQFMPLIVISGSGTANKIDSCQFASNIDNQDVQVKITKDNNPLFTLIENNLFKDKSKVSWKNGNGGECVQIGQDPILLGTKEAKSIVRLNKFIKCNGENEVISNKSSGNIYINNYFENCDGELVMRGGHDCVIDGNIFNGGTGGIRINGTGHTVINNQISDIKTAIRLMYGMAKGKIETGFYIAASHCIIKDNKITNASIGILVGDSKNADWTGKFDTIRYPSPVMQNIAPFDNEISGNVFTKTEKPVVSQ